MAAHPEPGVFEAFFAEHYNIVLAVVRRRLIGTQGDAEDIVSDVFRVAWSHHHAGNELTLPWLYAAVRNVVGAEYRRRRRLTGLLQRADWRAVRQPEVDDVDLRADIHAVMLRLRERDRELLYMAYWDQLTVDEIAQVLELHAGTVRTRLGRAKAALRRHLTTNDEPMIAGEVLSNG